MSEPNPVPTPAEAAQSEAASQAVRLVFSIAAVLIIVAVQRAAADPDFYRSLRMKLAKVRERAAAKTAWAIWQLAEKARLRYEQESA